MDQHLPLQKGQAATTNLNTSFSNQIQIQILEGSAFAIESSVGTSAIPTTSLVTPGNEYYVKTTTNQKSK